MPRVIAGAAAIALLLAPLATASAQDWPSRAVTMVVPYAAGGPVDTLGRILAARLSASRHISRLPSNRYRSRA